MLLTQSTPKAFVAYNDALKARAEAHATALAADDE